MSMRTQTPTGNSFASVLLGVQGAHTARPVTPPPRTEKDSNNQTNLTQQEQGKVLCSETRGLVLNELV